MNEHRKIGARNRIYWDSSCVTNSISIRLHGRTRRLQPLRNQQQWSILGRNDGRYVQRSTKPRSTQPSSNNISLPAGFRRLPRTRNQSRWMSLQHRNICRAVNDRNRGEKNSAVPDTAEQPRLGGHRS